jgi:hypothetical protein
MADTRSASKFLCFQKERTFPNLYHNLRDGSNLRLIRVTLQEFFSPKTFIHPNPLRNEGFPKPLLTRTMVPAEGEDASCRQKINYGPIRGPKLPSPSRGEGPGKALVPQRVRVNAGSCGKPARKVLPEFEPSQPSTDLNGNH